MVGWWGNGWEEMGVKIEDGSVGECMEMGLRVVSKGVLIKQ